MRTILNRDLRSEDVPPYSYARVADSYANIDDAKEGAYFNEYPYAMACLSWFTASFDLDRFEAETGKDLDLEADLQKLTSKFKAGEPLNEHLTVLRSGLLAMADPSGGISTPGEDRARLIDSILDAAFLDVSGGAERNASELGPREPGIGKWKHANPDFSGTTYRVVTESLPGADRNELFDRAAGRLMRAGFPEVGIDCLYLQPPAYPIDPKGKIGHIFTVFSGPTGPSRASEYFDELQFGEKVKNMLEDLTDR